MPSDGNKEEEEGDIEAHQTWDGMPHPTLFRLVPRTKRYLGIVWYADGTERNGTGRDETGQNGTKRE
ncbi:hypothetical protein EV1_004621 [Malus domestica]